MKNQLSNFLLLKDRLAGYDPLRDMEALVRDSQMRHENSPRLLEGLVMHCTPELLC
jgi:hypothetical protein